MEYKAEPTGENSDNFHLTAYKTVQDIDGKDVQVIDHLEAATIADLNLQIRGFQAQIDDANAKKIAIQAVAA